MKIYEDIYLDAVTDKILRIHSAKAAKERSFAIEEELPVSGSLQRVAGEGENGGIFATKFLEIHMSSDGMMDIYDRNQKLLCADYIRERKEEQSLSKEELEQMRQEGHIVHQNDDSCSFQVVKSLAGDEVIYGLGDKTGFLNKKGYDYMMWNSDNPMPQVENQTFKALYKSIPFFIVLREECVYGIFLDNTYRSYFDMGFESTDYYSFGAVGGELDYYFIAGDSVAEIVTGYTFLTGRAALPQMWTLGYQQSRWSYDSAEKVLEIAKNFRKYGIPCDAIHLDIDYMENFKVFTTNDRTFPDLRELSRELEAMGIKLVSIIDPGT
ncbi:MAG: alpha-glucosidase, partial [Lachnospiraceae bacterium]|nr:alpha-glucosidase [Lachnospiraceae bacterium]